ncbi:MAG: hypothetical protein Q8M11_03300 [Sulfuritalea sp.]|jgi:hypothetical protein|nr:hypothetical protein [Sulfuritalea sp.]MDP1984595.1 hypothetical protein [Sulfuritalea sp.]
MAIHDPADQARTRLEVRRFVARCETQISLIERADTLREVSRLATLISVPHLVADHPNAVDALRMMQMRAEDKARELITEDIQHFIRGNEHLRGKLKRAMFDAWTNLTGPLGHLRTWAQSKLTAAELQNPVQP